MLFALVTAAICLVAPIKGTVTEPFAPSGLYSGHWGLDFAAELGEEVRAPVTGTVRFAGSVAGMKSVTIQPVGGFKVSISYLATVGVGKGAFVQSGSVIGTAGLEKGSSSVHMSTRIGGRYVDPAGQMGCRDTDISRALRLVTPPQPYPRSHAHRNSRRNIRPDPHRPSSRWRNGVASSRSRSGAFHSSW